MQLQGSIPPSQVSTARSYPKADECILQLQLHCLKIHLSTIILGVEGAVRGLEGTHLADRRIGLLTKLE
jgi:hypothetical protein